MRKRTVKNLFDNIMWYTIYLLPILVGLISAMSVFGGDWFGAWLDWDGDFSWPPSYAFFENVTRQVCMSYSFSPVYNALVAPLELIGGGSVMWDDALLTHYFVYFISVYITHLFVDFFLFIPRLCHKWMNAFTNAE